MRRSRKGHPGQNGPVAIRLGPTPKLVASSALIRVNASDEPRTVSTGRLDMEVCPLRPSQGRQPSVLSMRSAQFPCLTVAGPEDRIHLPRGWSY